jgi:hypothetical protein
VKIDDIKPKIRVERSSAVFQSTNTTYNDSSTTYSSSLQTYGGADRVSDIGPKNKFIDDIKPTMGRVINL